jgi:hypothetical protein
MSQKDNDLLNFEGKLILRSKDYPDYPIPKEEKGSKTQDFLDEL